MRQRNNFGVQLISIVIPAYKQEKTIIRDIKRIHDSLQFLGYRHEIIVVIDGMHDKTYQKALTLKSSQIKIYAYEKNQGKGHAVRYGMMRAKGNLIGFIDAGMDIHPSGFLMLLNHMEWYNADVIVGSKLHPVSKVTYPFTRKMLSWGYRLFTATLFGFKIRDTQVGLKFFRRPVVRKVLPKLLVKRFAFDIEFLAVAHRFGYTRIFEAPVEVNFRQNSILSRNVWRIILLMLWDTMSVFYRLKIIRYYDIRKTRKRVTHNKARIRLSLQR